MKHEAPKERSPRAAEGVKHEAPRDEGPRDRAIGRGLGLEVDDGMASCDRKNTGPVVQCADVSLAQRAVRRAQRGERSAASDSGCACKTKKKGLGLFRGQERSRL